MIAENTRRAHDVMTCAIFLLAFAVGTVAPALARKKMPWGPFLTLFTASCSQNGGTFATFTGGASCSYGGGEVISCTKADLCTVSYRAQESRSRTGIRHISRESALRRPSR